MLHKSLYVRLTGFAQRLPVAQVRDFRKNADQTPQPRKKRESATNQGRQGSSAASLLAQAPPKPRDTSKRGPTQQATERIEVRKPAAKGTCPPDSLFCFMSIFPPVSRTTAIRLLPCIGCTLGNTNSRLSEFSNKVAPRQDQKTDQTGIHGRMVEFHPERYGQSG